MGQLGEKKSVYLPKSIKKMVLIHMKNTHKPNFSKSAQQLIHIGFDHWKFEQILKDIKIDIHV